MALIELHVATALLERIAIALERIAGPPPVIRTGSKTGQRIEVGDIFVASDEFTDKVAGERTKAAREIVGPMVEPGSDMEREVIEALEENVRRQYGDDAVKELPWRKVERGGS